MTLSGQWRPTVLSLFSGAGGLDYGLEAAGFDTRVCLDSEQDCCETLRQNRPWAVLERDVFHASTEELLSAGGFQGQAPDMLVGGPPCQPFSKSGYWVDGDALRLEDPRAATLVEFMRVWREALPRVVLFENVPGFAYQGKSEALTFIRDEVDRINREREVEYCVTTKVLQAADYGVPQLRERFILVASREARPFVFPAPTHHPAKQNGGFWDKECYRTAWDALADLPDDPGDDLAPRGKWDDLLPSIPEGQNYLFHTERGEGLPLFGWRRRFWSFLLKLAKELPSWTIQAQPGPAVGPFHWKSRRLGVREMQRLQTFPDDVTILGARGSVQRQVGNAVPSLLAEVLGRDIREQLLDGRVEAEMPRLMPPNRAPYPLPEPATAVPSKYLPLAGHHPAHPGTGKGGGRAK